MSLIIHAPNVHQSGGRALLLALLGSLKEGSVRQVILDARPRLDREPPLDVLVERVPPTVTGRLMAEWRLRRLARQPANQGLPSYLQSDGNPRAR
jgi:hypothetical protein